MDMLSLSIYLRALAASMIPTEVISNVLRRSSFSSQCIEIVSFMNLLSVFFAIDIQLKQNRMFLNIFGDLSSVYFFRL